MNAKPKIEIAFATGYGQADTHAAQLSDGRPNPSPDAGKPYALVTPAQILAMAMEPPAVPKEKAQWFIPSTYHQCDARNHDQQRQHGVFRWLPVDVDQNDLSLSDILSAVHSVLPGAACVIYSSRSSTAENRKWRALLPIRDMLSGSEYSETVSAFYDLLETASEGVLIPDRALARPGQLIYLPNRGEFYEHHFHKGSAAPLDETSPVIQRRNENRSRIQAAQDHADRERSRRQERRQPPGSTETPIEHFNSSHKIADLLSRYGYLQEGRSANWRSPLQTSGSFATRDFGDYWISLSGSDAAAGLGNSTPDGQRFGDAFDLYVHFEGGGDFTGAVRAYSEEAGLATKRTEPAPRSKASITPASAADLNCNAAQEADGALGQEGSLGVPEAEDDIDDREERDWPFRVTRFGVEKRHDRYDKDKKQITSEWLRISSELRVLAETRDEDGEDWGRLLEVADRDGRKKRWAMPMSLMAGDGSAIRDRLFSLGLVPVQGKFARDGLLEYIGSAEPEEKVRCVSRIGWTGGAFVLPARTLGNFS